MTAETLKSFDLYSACIKAFADDPSYGVVVVPMLSAQKPITTERAIHLDRLAAELSKPICLVWFNEWLEGPGSEIYDKSRKISMFRSMGRCMTGQIKPRSAATLMLARDSAEGIELFMVVRHHAEAWSLPGKG